MRKKLGYLLIMAFFLLAIPMSAQAFTINDNYWGADPTDNTERDVIGLDSDYGISGMDVSYSSGSLVVDIYSRYLDNIGSHQTALGDLFISNDGWNPFGPQPYTQDNSTNGEDWEYALVMGDNGNAILYDVFDPNIVLASAGGAYRAGQEVQYNARDQNSLATGSYEFFNLGGSDTDDFIRYTIDFDFGGPLGFHYASATCANDVIEGSIPEPASILLLGSGLIFLTGIGRRRFKK